MKTVTIDAQIPTLGTRDRTYGYTLIAKHPDFILGSSKHLVEVRYNASFRAFFEPLFSLYKQTLR